MATAQSSDTKKTPKSVIEAAKKADKMHQEVYGGNTDDTVDPAAVPKDPGTEDSVAGGDTQPVEAKPPAEVEDTSGDPPPTKPKDEPKDEPKVEDKPKSESEDWKTKYLTLQGKYNAEVPRLSQDNRDLRAQLLQLQEAVQELKSKATAEGETGGQATPKKKPLVSDEEIADYGEDLVDFIRRVTRGEAEDLVKDLKPTIDEVRGQVQESAAAQAKNAVYATLDREVPEWRQINSSPEFISWLNLRDPYADAVRQDLLMDAFKKGAASRVSAFFQGFLAEQRAVEPKPSPEPKPEPKPTQQVSLEELAGPGRGNGADTQPTPTDKNAVTWTRAQIAAFYRDVHTGKFDKNPARQAEIENSIAAAVRGGRVT